MLRIILAALAVFFVCACQTTASAECPEYHVKTAQFLAYANRNNASIAHTFASVEAERIVDHVNNTEPKTNFRPDHVVVFDAGTHAAIVFVYGDIDCVYTKGFFPVPVVQQWLFEIFTKTSA